MPMTHRRASNLPLDVWDRRRAKYGPLGLSAAGRERLIAAAAKQRATRTHCKHGHAFAEHAVVRNGVRVCVPCRRTRKRERTRRAAGLDGPALTVAGQSLLSVRLRQAWAVRKQKWPSGISSEALARARTRRRLDSKLARTCRRGHRWTGANTIIRAGGSRLCRACLTLRSHRARWTKHHRRKIEALRQAMLDAHPDKGGTAARFREARRRWVKAKAA
jgi:hypothetical protein